MATATSTFWTTSSFHSKAYLTGKGSEKNQKKSKLCTASVEGKTKWTKTYEEKKEMAKGGIWQKKYQIMNSLETFSIE